MIGNSISRAFTAPTLGAFWLYWNPVYGFILARFCYRPIRRRLPDSIAVVSTFAVSGFFLHDLLLWPARLAAGKRPLFPVVTLAFVVVALLVIATDALEVDMHALRPATRAAIHLLCLALAFAASILASRFPW